MEERVKSYYCGKKQVASNVISLKNILFNHLIVELLGFSSYVWILQINNSDVENASM